MSEDPRLAVVAKAAYDALEGPINNQDAKRQREQWERCLLISPAVLLAIDAMPATATAPAPVARCDGCKWWRVFNSGETKPNGSCHGVPPALWTGNISAFPETSGHHFCPLHTPKEGPT